MHARHRSRFRGRNLPSTFAQEMASYGASDAWDFTTQTYIRGGVLAPSGITFTRASDGYAETGDGRLVNFGSNVLRQTDKGVLIEGARTNLLLRSQEFNDAVWGKVQSTVTANAAVAPDGTMTADFLLPNTTSNQHRVDQTPVTVAGLQTFSVFAKASGYDFVSLRIGTTGKSFNLSSGVIGASGTASATITAFQNGWYRCAITVSAAANDICRINVDNADSVPTIFTGDGTSGILIWGAQLEAASTPSSYILTEAASATRAADDATVTGLTGVAYPLSMFSAFQLTTLISGASQNVIAVNDAAGDLNLLYAVPGTGARTYVENNGATQAFLTITTTFAANTTYRIASRAGADDFRVAFNGTLSSADTSGLAPATPTRIGLGNEFTGSNRLFGYLRSAAIIPGTLTNVQLQEITT